MGLRWAGTCFLGPNFKPLMVFGCMGYILGIDGLYGSRHTSNPRFEDLGFRG